MRQEHDHGVVGNVGDHVGRDWLWLQCQQCQHSTRLDPLDVIERAGRDISLWTLLERARCSTCGGRRPELRLHSSCRPDLSDAPRQRPPRTG